MEKKHYLRGMKEINVPQTIIEAVSLPQVAMKIVYLERIKNHPVHPYIMETITKVIDMCIEKDISPQETFVCVNETLKMFAVKFYKEA